MRPRSVRLWVASAALAGSSAAHATAVTLDLTDHVTLAWLVVAVWAAVAAVQFIRECI